MGRKITSTSGQQDYVFVVQVKVVLVYILTDKVHE